MVSICCKVYIVKLPEYNAYLECIEYHTLCCNFDRMSDVTFRGVVGDYAGLDNGLTPHRR